MRDRRVVKPGQLWRAHDESSRWWSKRGRLVRVVRVEGDGFRESQRVVVVVVERTSERYQGGRLAEVGLRRGVESGMKLARLRSSYVFEGES